MLENTIHAFAAGFLEEAVQRDLGFLVKLVMATVEMGRVSIAHLARGLEGGSQKVRERRVRRFCKEFKFSEVELAKRLIEPLLLADPEAPLVLATDPTHLGHCWVITTAVVMRDRALPVLKTVVGPNERLKHAIERHFRDLRKAIPKERMAIILADGAFGHPAMICLLGDTLGFDYVLRFNPRTCVRVHDRNDLDESAVGTDFVQCADLHVPTAIPSDLGIVDFGRTEALPVRAIQYWDRNFPHPWCLVTSLTASALAVFRLYSFRFRVEHLFRDEKSQRFGLGLDGYAYADVHRLSVLELVTTLSYHLLVRAGKYAEYRGWTQYCERKNREIALWRVGRNFLRDPKKRDRLTVRSLNYITQRLPLRVKGLITYTPHLPKTDWTLAFDGPGKEAPSPKPTRASRKVRPSLGERLRVLYKQAGLTQAQLATKLDVTQQRIGQIVCNDAPVPFSWLEMLAEVFNTTVNELIKGTSYVPPDRRTSLKHRSGLVCTPQACTA